MAVLEVEHAIISLATAVDVLRPDQPPAGRKSGAVRAAAENVVVHVPDGCLTGAGITQHPVRVAVAVKVSYLRRSCRGRGSTHHYYLAYLAMLSTIVRKRTRTVECVSESRSLVTNSRIPYAV